MKTCFLHAGIHKTGTTALQRYLSDNFHALRARGLLAPRFGMTNAGAHYDLVRALVGTDGGSLTRADAESVAPRFSAWQGDLIVSSESLQNLLALRQAGPVAAYFQDCGYRVVVVLHLREQAEWANAVHGQVVKSFRYAGSLRNYIAEMNANGYFLYSNRIAGAEAVGCDVIVRRYDAATRRNGIVADFFSAIGRPVDAADPIVVNASIGPVGIAAARDLLKRLVAGGLSLSGYQTIHCATAFQAIYDAMPPETARYWGLSAAQTAFVRDVAREDNRRVADRFWSGEPLEPAERETTVFDPAVATGEDRDRYRQLVDAAWPRLLAIAQDAGLARRDLPMVWRETVTVGAADIELVPC